MALLAMVLIWQVTPEPSVSPPLTTATPNATPSAPIQFGTDKVCELGDFASTLILGLMVIAIESVMRFAQEIREIIEQSSDTKISDLHVWLLGLEARAAIAIVAGNASVTADIIRERLVQVHDVTHLTVALRCM